MVGVVQAESHLMRYADVHQDQIVFTYEDDLWLVSTDGGDARRITNDPGMEGGAKFSPDGRMIAFTAQYDGGIDVYVMDTAGSVPVRLTYHPAADRVLGWFPDGKHVLFRSRREWPRRGDMIYKVAIDGGMPVKLPVDRAGLTALSPDGGQIAYNRISRESNTWKRHQGGTAQDIWLGSLAKGDFKKITDWPGTDNYPMWRGDAIYFASDRAHGTLNIYKYDLPSGQVTPMTTYQDYDVKLPSIGVDQIVYQYAETLHLLDLRSGDIRPVRVNIPSDLTRMRPEFVEVSPSTGSFGLSPTGKRMLLAARGEILNLPVEDGEPINLTKTTDSREKNAAWSPDGRWVAFLSDRTGEEELYLVDQKAEQPCRQLTTGGKGFRMQPVWSPDSQWLVFSDKFLRLNLVNAESGALTVVDQGDYDDAWERWGIQDYVWSPDSRWIAYTKMEQSLTEGIFLYSMDSGTAHRVTDEVHNDWSPSFDPKGRYLYFLSNRHFAPIMGFVDQNYICLDMAQPFIIVLKEGEPSPFAPKDAHEEIEEDEPAEKKEEEGDDSADEKAEKPETGKDKDDKGPEPVEIDLDGLARRIIAARGVPAGNYFRLEATDKGFLYLKKDEPEFEKYQTVTDSTGGRLDLYHYKLEDEETKRVLGGIANYHLSADGKKLVYRSGSRYGVVDAAAKASVGDGEVKLDRIRIEVDRNKEFVQIFKEAWRVQRDWFYDPGMHGVDWEAIGEKYRKFLPDCGNRSDLNYLIGEMIGELNAGHTYVWGGDIEDNAKRVSTGLLGVDFATEPGVDHYRIEHIIPGTTWHQRERSPLAEIGSQIKEGDYLIAIDGEPVTTKDNVFRLLQNKAGMVVTLTYNDRPTAEEAKTQRVKTLRSEWPIRYREWVDRNRALVEERGRGEVGYLHIPDMGRNGLVEFSRYYFPHHYRKGFIIDERYNGGGFTSAMIIDRLERDLFGLTKPREGKVLHEPERVFHGHMIVLVNEDTGSAGEWFAEAIKGKKLAPVLGMRTWGGAVGIELHQPLADGGRTTPPQFGPYNVHGEWIIEGHGVVPDIEVQNMPSEVLRGRDTQLEAAVQYILARLADEPMEIPPPPAYPDKSKGK
jgi:tricorn protease